MGSEKQMVICLRTRVWDVCLHILVLARGTNGHLSTQVWDIETNGRLLIGVCTYGVKAKKEKWGEGSENVR